MRLSEKQEKALVEWVAAQAAEREEHLKAQGYIEVVSPVTQRATKAARTYLATLEKPEPTREWIERAAKAEAKYGGPCDPPKPEPKRGVERELVDLIAWMRDEPGTQPFEWVERTLRLYREERERVDAAIQRLRNLSEDARLRPWGRTSNEPWVGIERIIEECLERRDG